MMRLAFVCHHPSLGERGAKGDKGEDGIGQRGEQGPAGPTGKEITYIACISLQSTLTH